MSGMNVRRVPGFLLLSIFCLAHLSAAQLSFKITPSIAAEGLTPSVKLDCRLTSIPQDLKLLILFRLIHKDHNATTALLAEFDIGGDITLSGSDRIKANGNIDDEPYHLTLTINEPFQDDSGKYECILTYLSTEIDAVNLGAKADLIVAGTREETVVAVIQPADRSDECEAIWTEIDSIKAALQAQPATSGYEGSTTSPEPVGSDSGSRSVDGSAKFEPVGTYAAEPLPPGSCRVSFSAHFRSRWGYMIYDKEVAIFDATRTNKGGAYDINTGEFTAPCDGQYFFTVTLRTEQDYDGGYADGVLMVDDVKVARTSAFVQAPILNIEQATISTVLSLNQGQKVKVMMETSSTGNVQGDEYSIFSGFFLSP